MENLSLQLLFSLTFSRSMIVIVKSSEKNVKINGEPECCEKFTLITEKN